MKPNVVTFTQAAKEKDCGRTTVYRAAWRDELNTAEIGSRDMILRDDAFERWQPRGPGGWPREEKPDNDGNA